MENRRFVRIKPGVHASRGKIIVDVKTPAIDCLVVDSSAGGACLELNPGVVPPKRFELFFGGVKKKCRVAWTHGRRIGVAF
ncbi:MAG: PilZ domain-containing protein [Bradyrhizobiaceae bacterium]|nr:MAG: PilZ domain-containing protein [Bradyrhizobiaceae bacterium]